MPINWSKTTIAGPRKNVKPTNSARNIPPVSTTLTSMYIRLGEILDILMVKRKSSHRAFPKKNQKLICKKNKYKSLNCMFLFPHQRSLTVDFYIHLVSKRPQVILIFFNGLLVMMKRLQMLILQPFPVVILFLQKTALLVDLNSVTCIDCVKLFNYLF